MRSLEPGMSNRFPYAERARSLDEAHRAVRQTFEKVTKRSDLKHPATAKWIAAIAEFNAAQKDAYPPDFWSDLQELRSGNAGQIETAITFLEADTMCFGSGYVKDCVLRAIKRLPLNSSQAKRLRAVVLHVASRRDGQEFRQYCRLARRLDSEEFRKALRALQSLGNADITRRAAWVLAALDQAS
ncbi:MAG: hypothetical protein ACKV2U_04625 [Bryobacteraceae bacterium]